MNESWYNAEAAAGVARVNPILAVLADGAKTYRELFGIVANLDETLKGLRDRREISLVTSWDGVNRFALPSPPAREPEDVPKRPVLHLPKKPKPEPYGDLRVCKTCGVEKRTSQFGWVRNRFSRKSTCTKCYYEKSKRGSGMAGSHASSMENVNGATSAIRDSAGRPGDGAVHTGAVC
jgi:hypothetical protein